MVDLSITPKNIEERIQGFSLTATNARPDIATMESIITESCATVLQYLSGKGISEIDHESPTWHVARSCAIDMCVSKAELVRNRGTTELVNETWDRVRQQLSIIRDTPALVDGGSTSRAANRGTRGRRDMGRHCRDRNLLDRLIWERKL